MDAIKPRNSSLHYMPQLDGLRAFAVAAVLIRHFFHPERVGGIDFALLAVWLFFVLSGFLITGILLRSRDQADDGGDQRRFALRQFYIRRFLRIFPLYYLVLSIAAILDLSDVRDTILWHLAYASNYLFAAQGQYGSVTGHLWSLSVEEQFYVLWPALILFVPRRYLSQVIIAAIAIGPMFRLVGHFLDFNWVTRYAALPACLDPLGIGALLAYFLHHGDERPTLIKYFRKYVFWLGLPGVILVLLLRGLEHYDLVPAAMKHFWFVLEPAAWPLVLVWLVDRASSGFSGMAGQILGSKPLIYIGKISYGIYIYHLFIYFLMPLLLLQINFDFSVLPRALQFSLLVGTTVGIAALSWHCFENPINSLKNRFAGGHQRIAQRRQPTQPAYL
jgi:peptidoglycan/LPS O-acetylase OafA/YrhL